MPDLDDEEWAFVVEYMRLVFKPILVRPFRFERAYTEAPADLTLKGKSLFLRKALNKGVREAKAPGVVFLNRIQFGFASVMAMMGAEGDFRGVMDAIDADLAAQGGADAPVAEGEAADP